MCIYRVQSHVTFLGSHIFPSMFPESMIHYVVSQLESVYYCAL